MYKNYFTTPNNGGESRHCHSNMWYKCVALCLFSFWIESVLARAVDAWQQMRVGEMLSWLPTSSFCQKGIFILCALSVLFISYSDPHIRTRECEETESIDIQCHKVAEPTHAQFVLFFTQALLFSWLTRLDYSPPAGAAHWNFHVRHSCYELPKGAEQHRQHPTSMICGGPESSGEAGTENRAAASGGRWNSLLFYSPPESRCRESGRWKRNGRLLNFPPSDNGWREVAVTNVDLWRHPPMFPNRFILI